MRRRIRILSAISMLIFHLFVCFASVFAWFYAGYHNDATDMGLMIDANELTLAYQLYKYDIEEKEVIEINDFDFNAYDTIITKYNEYTALILKVTLFSNLFVENEQRDVNVSLHCTSDNSTDAVLSNILYFKSSASYIDEDDIYFNVKEELEDETKYTFITTTKLTDINYTITVTPVEDRKAVMYSIIDYDEDLIDLMNIDYHNVPDFTNDITYIRYGVNA